MNKHIIRVLIITAYTFLCINVLKSQPNIPAYIQSPNAASLGMYGNVPVSFYRGTPQVSVPLYSTSVRGVDLNISLEHDASGVLLNSLPSWTGHNWNLQAGGVITRQVQDAHDEERYFNNTDPHLPNLLTKKCYFKSYQYLRSWMNLSEPQDTLADNTMYEKKDICPDIFTFSFMGKSGKFFMDSDGQWKVQSDENFDIICNVTDTAYYSYPFLKYKTNTGYLQYKIIKGFKIRDENGTIYEFGFKKDAIEYSTNFFRMDIKEYVETWHSDSWYLTKILDKYGQTLYDFNYERGYYIVQFHNAYEENQVFTNNGWQCVWGDIFPYHATICSPVYLRHIKTSNGVNVSFSLSYAEDSIAPKRLYNSIYGNFPNPVEALYQNMQSKVFVGTFDDHVSQNINDYPFYYLQDTLTANVKDYIYNQNHSSRHDIIDRTRLAKLSSITISCNQLAVGVGTEANTTTQFKLDYSFNSRMHLVGIKKRTGLMSDYVPFYKFKYDHYDLLPVDYLTKKVDHWGYYNGTTYNESNIALPAFRAPNSTLCKYGSLIQVTYPTGGVSVFEYEPNDYAYCLSGNRQYLESHQGIAGSLRIKSISEYEDSTLTSLLGRREFYYKIPGTNLSSGQLFSKPKYSWNWSATDGYDTYNLITYRTNSIVPLANSFTPAVGYSDVEERMYDGSKTFYKYYNYADAELKDSLFFWTFQTPGAISPFDKFSERGFCLGKMKTQTKYDSNNQKLSVTRYSYTANSNANYVLAHNIEQKGTIFNVNNQIFVGGVYKLFYQKYDLSEVCDTTMTDEGDSTITHQLLQRDDATVTLTTPYIHNTNIRYLRNESVFRGYDSYVKTHYYPFDTDYLVFYSDTSRNDRLYRMFCVEPCLTNNYLNSSFVNTDFTTYNKKVLSSGIYSLPRFSISINDVLERDTLISYDDYTSKGALSQYTEKGKPSKYLKWAFNDNYLMMESDAPISLDFSPYEYYQLNIPLRSNPLGIVSMFDADDMVGLMRTYMSSHTSHSKGYVYYPLCGLAAVVQPNGSALYYEYDSFGRLAAIYDNQKRKIKSFNYNFRH